MENKESLKGIAEWLKDIEHLAGFTYKAAASGLDEDSSLTALLKHLSDDEA